MTGWLSILIDWWRIIPLIAGYVIVAVVTVMVLHELAHILVARFYGVRTRGLILFWWGIAIWTENDNRWLYRNRRVLAVLLAPLPISLLMVFHSNLLLFMIGLGNLVGGIGDYMMIARILKIPKPMRLAEAREGDANYFNSHRKKLIRFQNLKT